MTNQFAAFIKDAQYKLIQNEENDGWQIRIRNIRR